MEDDNEYLDLPDDPEEGFAVLQVRKHRELEQRLENNPDHWRFERDYVNVLVAYDEVHQLDYLVDWRKIPSSNDDFADYFTGFAQRVEIIKQKILVERARRLKSGASTVVVLDAPARMVIHKFIEAIREKLNELKLPEGKRDALFNKLNSFAAEVDRNRTRTEAFNAFAVDIARTAREVNDEIKPLQETIDRIFDWLDKAAKWKDSLLPWSERKEIPPPPKGLPKPDLDDDIPF